MAQELGTGYIIISPSTKGLGKAIEGSIGEGTTKGTKVSSSTILSKVGGAFGKVGKIGVAAVGTVTGAMAGLAAKGGFDRALNIERAQTKLKALGHDTTAVQAIMDDALAAVKGTAFGLGDAASVAATMVASGIKPGKELAGVLTTVGDVAQVSGRSYQDMGVIFSQVAAKGKLQGDEMLQLMQSGIPVLQYLADHFKITTEEAQDMVSSGKVSFKDFEAAMREHLGGAAQKAGDSFDGAMANIKAALSRLGESFGTPLLGAFTKLGNALIPVIDKINAALAPLVEKFKTQLTGAVNQATAWIEKFSASLEKGNGSLQDLASKIGLAVAGFTTLAAVGGNIDPLLNVIESVSSSMEGLTAGAQRIPEKFGKIWQNASSGVQQFAGVFNKGIREAMTVDGSTFAAAANRIAQGFNGIHSQFSGFAGKLASTKLGQSVGSAFGSMHTAISAGFGRVQNGFSSGWQTISSSITNNPVVQKIGEFSGKIGSAFSNVAGKVSSALAPVGEVFGGFGDMVAGPLQSGLGKIGDAIMRFFNPANFMKFVGIGAIIAALVAGLGALNQATGGQISAWISNLAAQAPGWVAQIGAGIQSALPGLIAQGSQIIWDLMSAITTVAPMLIETGGQLVLQLLTGLGQALPTLLPMGALMITTILTSLVEQLPTIMEGGLSLITGLVQGIMAALPVLIEAAPEIINNFVTSLVTMLPMILQTGMQLLTTLIDGIVSQIPALIAMLPTIINNTVSTLTANLPKILQTGIQLLLRLIDGIVQAIPQLIAAVPQIIASFVSTIASNLPRILATGIQIIGQLAAGLIQAIPRVVAAVPQIVSGIKNAFTGISWSDVGANIINGIKSGLSAMASSLWESAKSIAKGALDAAKSFLGIHSPSRVFRDQVGKMVGAGFVLGLDAMGPAVEKAGESLAKDAIPNAPTMLPVFGLDDPARKTDQYAGMAGDWKSTTYNITINGRELNADQQLLGLLDRLVKAAGVAVKAR